MHLVLWDKSVMMFLVCRMLQAFTEQTKGQKAPPNATDQEMLEIVMMRYGFLLLLFAAYLICRHCIIVVSTHCRGCYLPSGARHGCNLMDSFFSLVAL